MNSAHGGGEGALRDGEGLVVREDAQLLVSSQTAGLAVGSSALTAPARSGRGLTLGTALFLPTITASVLATLF